jgi:predicted naringenin-chalcone synthase
MTLSGYIPELIEQDFQPLVERALDGTGHSISSINNWCIHPGGKRILEAVSRSLSLDSEALAASYATMSDYGNMSSPTILFVLKRILDDIKSKNADDRATHEPVFGAAFGPGLTMETFVASY